MCVNVCRKVALKDMQICCETSETSGAFPRVSLAQARRDMEREMAEYQNRLGDPEVEKKLKAKVRKYKTLLQDLTQELEHEREMRGNSAMVKSLRNQLEDLQASERTAVKTQKRLQEEVEELQTQSDELTRTKMEVWVVWC